MKFLSDESYNKLIKSSMDLANEITTLKKENEKLKFIIETPSKYNVSQEVKEGIVLEKRVKNGGTNIALLGVVNGTFIKDIIQNQRTDFNKLDAIKRMCSDKYWEYRVFNKELQSEKWISEANLNPKP